MTNQLLTKKIPGHGHEREDKGDLWIQGRG